MRKTTPIKAEDLPAILRVDVCTGRIFWTKTRGPASAGAEAGFWKRGRRFVTVFGKDLAVSRVVWALHYGAWPNGDLDHIDRDPGNNTLSNLREVSHAENMQNRRLARSNTVGATGVKRSGRRWCAQISANGSYHHLGTFDSLELAAEAYRAAKAKLHI